MDTPVGHPPQSDPASVTPMLRTVVLADLADSTQFIERLGDAPAAALLQRLDLQIRDLLVFTNGRLIDKADGLLALFERPVQAVDFALRYQHALRDLSADVGMELKARIGIHVGDVMTWVNTPQAVAAGAKPLEVEGLAKPVAARLMSLAMPGQILMSGMAQTLAHRAQSELGERANKLRWLVHGRYRFKGVPAPMIVHEVGEAGFSPLRLPPSGQKSWREVPLWRRPPVLAVEILCVIGVLGGTLYTTLRSPPALAFGDRDWVVVGDVNNLTGDPTLDATFDTALRVGLQQSSYLNLLPEARVDEALSRMGRKAETPIDRGIGAEIAQREGARALLLPTVTEVGGKLRVSLEVVDPNTQATVYTEMAEGRGKSSLLASLDSANAELREQLGESMGEIKAKNKPLAQVTTSNMDALRAYSLAITAARGAKYQEALRLLDLAIKLDPQFALAYSSRGQLYVGANDNAAARADFATADKFRSKLTVRESMTLDTTAAALGPPDEAMAKYKLFTDMYPDQFGPYLRSAQLNWAYLQHFEDGIEGLQPALNPKNPRQQGAYYLLGMMNLALGRNEAAKAAFSSYESLGGGGYNLDYAALYASQRKFDDAQRILRKRPSFGMAGADLEMRLTEISYPADRGDINGAIKAAGALQKVASPGVPLQARAYDGMALSLRAYGDREAALPGLRRWVASEAKFAADPAHADQFHARFASLYGASLLARLGDVAAAEQVVGALRKDVSASGFPTLVDVLAMADAEIALARGNPSDAVTALTARVNGFELYQVHAVLMRAQLAAGDKGAALTEARWLAGNRGRAYVEWSSQYLLQPTNLVESNLALLVQAELLKQGNHPDQAAAALGEFGKAWPKPPDMVARRLAQF